MNLIHFENQSKRIGHALAVFALTGYVIGFVMGAGTTFLIASTILGWHK